jgi:hypothetical protein
MMVFSHRHRGDSVMERFVGAYRDRVIGVLSGFDRMLFRGSLLGIAYPQGLLGWLSSHSILLKNFAALAKMLSDQVKKRAEEVAAQVGRPFEYISSPSVSKESVADKIRLRDGITEGLICVLSCVEPCRTFEIRRNGKTKRLDLVAATRKCLHVYFYFVDREFGLMHVRLQTWLPMTLQVCLNGREYLARQMDAAGIGYERRDNSFTRIDDLPAAQRLLDRLAGRKWAKFFNALARRLNPWVAAGGPYRFQSYYWTLRQSEYATDIMFRDARSLAEIYPRLTEHAWRCLAARDVLRFLGRRTNSRFSGEVTSKVSERPEGVCVKHRVEENSIKMYDKQGSVLRIETTINDPRRFKVRRTATRKGRRVGQWVPMRKGLADLPRRVEVSRAANERYLEALAEATLSARSCDVLDPVSRRVTHKGRPHRAMRPLSADEAAVFQAVLHGEHAVQGFRNRDIRRALRWDAHRDAKTQRQVAARTTRLFALLRAHGLIAKVSPTSYYRVTTKGHRVMTTALKLRQVNLHALAA